MELSEVTVSRRHIDRDNAVELLNFFEERLPKNAYSIELCLREKGTKKGYRMCNIFINFYNNIRISIYFGTFAYCGGDGFELGIKGKDRKLTGKYFFPEDKDKDKDCENPVLAYVPIEKVLRYIEHLATITTTV